MKKRLLLAALLMGGLFTSNAQELLFSFEGGEEGFTLGEIDGQNFWSLSNTTTPSENFTVSDQFDATDGTNVLRVEGSNAPSQTLLGVYSAQFNSAFPGDQYVISEDVFIDENDATDGSDVYFDQLEASDTELNITSRIVFANDGTLVAITAMTSSTTAPFTYTAIGTYPAGKWFKFSTAYDYAAGTVKYYIDKDLIYSGDLFSGQSVNLFAYRYSNGTTGFTLDNIAYTAGEFVAGTKNVAATEFKVYPNPANNVVNIANNNNVPVTGVSLTDINGRIVKTAKFDGIANAQVNISDLASGVYMMSISSDKGTTVKKIVKN